MFFIDIYVKTDGAWNKVNVENGAKVKYMAPVMIEFQIGENMGYLYAEMGMTWGEWVNTSYSTEYNNIFTAETPGDPDSRILYDMNGYGYIMYVTYHEDYDYIPVKASDQIIKDYIYYAEY